MADMEPIRWTYDLPEMAPKPGFGGVAEIDGVWVYRGRRAVLILRGEVRVVYTSDEHTIDQLARIAARAEAIVLAAMAAEETSHV